MSQEKIFKFLTLFIIVVIILIGLYKFCFINIEAIYDSYYILGEIFYAIALSIIASYIFYIFNVYIPESRKEKVRKEKASLIIKYYINDIKHFVDSIQNKVVRLGYDSSQGDTPDFKSCLSNIRILSFDKSKKDAHYTETFEYWKSLFDEVRTDLVNRSESLSTHLFDDIKKESIGKLLDLPDKCTMSVLFRFGDHRLSDYASDFKKLFEAIEDVENDLNQYLEKEKTN